MQLLEIVKDYMQTCVYENHTELPIVFEEAIGPAKFMSISVRNEY